MCDHIRFVRQPAKDKPVYREECTQCFSNDESESGVNVCLTCFNGSCSNHSNQHATLCHPIVLNIRKKEIVRPQQDEEMKEEVTTIEQLEAAKKKLAEEESQPKYYYEHEVRCLTCKITLDTAANESLAKCVTTVLESKAPAASDNLQAIYDEEVKEDCSHCVNLVQASSPPQLADRALTTCAACNVNDAMWLCLTCGALGCSRRQMKADKTFTPGNGHAAQHAQETGHPIAVKMGTITADGRGDCYCYSCDSSLINSKLGAHLATFGIPIVGQEATVLSTVEQNLQMNLNMNWSLVFEEDGREAELAFGPGRTGLTNLGNSCYMASILQVLYSIPHFYQQYYQAAVSHLASCSSVKPSDCFQCQMSKLSIGLLSGSHDPQPSAAVLAEIAQERAAREAKNLAIKEGRLQQSALEKESATLKVQTRKPLQYGIPPRMFKVLLHGKHAEFASARQQDSFEYIHFLLDTIKQKENGLTKFDPYTPFYFQQEERLECTRCHQVRYKNIKQTELQLSIPLPEPLPPKQDDSASSTSADGKPKKAPSVEYPPISFESCLSEWSKPSESSGWSCPTCKSLTDVRQQVRMSTFPEVLMVNLRRFVMLKGWVPEKLDIEVQFDAAKNGDVTVDALRAKGKQENEVELPVEAASASSVPAAKQPDAGIVSNLVAMGFSENACKRAALAVDNSSADAAAAWLFGHMEDADINDPLPAPAAAASSSAPAAAAVDAEALMMLESMGFDSKRCTHALKQCGGNAERAADWLFSHMDDDIPMEDASASSGSAASAPADGPVVIDQAPANYELFGFVTHMGKSTGSGHYVAHVKRDGKWMLFNDHKVNFASNPLKAAGYGYIYFFRRKSA